MQNNRYRQVDVAGRPREMGRQLGEAARAEIQGFAEIALRRVNKTVAVSRQRALWVAEKSTKFAEQYSSEMMDELRGIAEGSQVPLPDIMLLQVRNQLKADPESACTSFSVVRSERAPAMLAQNWDNDSALDPFTIVLTRRPIGKPAFMNVTQAGLIAYIGFSEVGMGVCLNTLPAPSREIGVPHYFTVREIYQSTTLEAAVHAVQRAHRAIPANIMLATPQGPADLEVTIDDVHVLTNPAAGIVTHANHCLHPDLGAHNAAFPELIQSYPRQERIDGLLRTRPVGLREAKESLSDHSGFPKSICRHQNEDPQTGEWQTVFSVIIEPNERRMHISRGTPCTHPYETYHLA